MKKLGSILTALLLAVFNSGCGDGGGGTSSSSSSASALKVAEKVSVVDSSETAKSASVEPLKVAFPRRAAASALSAASDYNTDETIVYVAERSAESFDIINEILCMMGQTRYDG